MRTTYKFYAWSASGGAGNSWAWVNVDWTYDKTSKKISITGVEYAGDQYGNPGYWYVGSSMKFGVKWSDGVEEIMAEGTYNFPYQIRSGGGGFVTKSGVLGVISDAGAHLKSHTFSGSSGGFTIWFGSTSGTINAGNPQSYRQLEKTGGDDTEGLKFSSPPNLDKATVTSSNPSLYRLKSGISGINWGEGYSSRNLTAKVKYTIDGSTKEYTAYSNNNPGTSASFDINAFDDATPWNRVPDDETVTITWIASTDVGSKSKAKTQYCMMQYDVFVIDERINNGEPVASEIKVSTAAGKQPNQPVRRIWSITE